LSYIHVLHVLLHYQKVLFHFPMFVGFACMFQGAFIWNKGLS
jgi:hypothetical protein